MMRIKSKEAVQSQFIYLNLFSASLHVFSQGRFIAQKLGYLQHQPQPPSNFSSTLILGIRFKNSTNQNNSSSNKSQNSQKTLLQTPGLELTIEMTVSLGTDRVHKVPDNLKSLSARMTIQRTG